MTEKRITRWKTIFYCGLKLSGRKRSIGEKSSISRIDGRFAARVCALGKLCSSFFLLPRARFFASNQHQSVAISASVSSQTSTQSCYASDYLYLHLQPSRLAPHSHILLPSLVVNSFALYVAELTSLRMPHCLPSSDRLRLKAPALGVSGVAISVEGENIS